MQALTYNLLTVLYFRLRWPNVVLKSIQKNIQQRCRIMSN